ncbi:hypothetical protein CRV24_003560 [Beauveria bassiana]|nr:hypothetical protein CRV24_003560 [Beauveria bassiana]
MKKLEPRAAWIEHHKGHDAGLDPVQETGKTRNGSLDPYIPPQVLLVGVTGITGFGPTARPIEVSSCSLHHSTSSRLLIKVMYPVGSVLLAANTLLSPVREVRIEGAPVCAMGCCHSSLNKKDAKSLALSGRGVDAKMPAS